MDDTPPSAGADGDAALAAFRRSIDNIDAALIHMLAERFRITQAVGQYKAARDLPAADLMFTNTAVPAALRGMQSELQQNLHQPYFIRDVLLQCPGLGAMLQDGGARAGMA